MQARQPSLLAPPPRLPPSGFMCLDAAPLSLHLLRANTPMGSQGLSAASWALKEPMDTLCGCFPESGDHATPLGGAPRSRWGNTKASGSDAKVERQSWEDCCACQLQSRHLCKATPSLLRDWTPSTYVQD